MNINKLKYDRLTDIQRIIDKILGRFDIQECNNEIKVYFKGLIVIETDNDTLYIEEDLLVFINHECNKYYSSSCFSPLKTVSEYLKIGHIIKRYDILPKKFKFNNKK